jgi:hypothetical protein
MQSWDTTENESTAVAKFISDISMDGSILPCLRLSCNFISSQGKMEITDSNER